MGAGYQGSRPSGKAFGCRRHPATHEPAVHPCSKGSQRPAELEASRGAPQCVGPGRWGVGEAGAQPQSGRVGALPVLGSPLAGRGVKQHGPEGASEQPHRVSSIFCSGLASKSLLYRFLLKPKSSTSGAEMTSWQYNKYLCRTLTLMTRVGTLDLAKGLSH